MAVTSVEVTVSSGCAVSEPLVLIDGVAGVDGLVQVVVVAGQHAGSVGSGEDSTVHPKGIRTYPAPFSRAFSME